MIRGSCLWWVRLSSLRPTRLPRERRLGKRGEMPRKGKGMEEGEGNLGDDMSPAQISVLMGAVMSQRLAPRCRPGDR